MHVLIIEDNAALATNIGEYLEQQGDEPDFAMEGALGLRLCQLNRYDAIVLDLRLPRIDGIELCRRLRDDHRDSTPILMLTARDTLDDRIEGFEAGTDDYLTKPFSLRELYLRLRALARRPVRGDAHLTAGNLQIDRNRHLIRCNGNTFELAPIGYRILELLVRAHPNVVTRRQIENAIWHDRPPDSQAALRGHIHRLRQLIETPRGVRRIKTVHGVGYRLIVDD